jgi:hypothetical protein
MALRQGHGLGLAAIALMLAVGATGCGKNADGQARDALKSAVQDVGPHSRSMSEYCRKHIAMSDSDCLDVFSNAAAYCPWPDNNMPTILKSWAGNDGRTLRVRGRYRDGTTYIRDVVVVTYQGHLKLAYPYWLDSHSQPPCPSS